MPTIPTTAGPTAKRIHMMLAAGASTRDVSMFGGLSFMVKNKMIVGVRELSRRSARPLRSPVVPAPVS